MQGTFRSFWVEETASGITRRVIERRVADLPPGDVLVRVQFSSLNYKDGLSASGNRGVTRSYPHAPGIDAAGVVLESAVSAWQPGDNVLVAHPSFGVSHPGGFAQLARVPGDWLARLPAGLSAREAMGYGTAGFTAALCLDRLQAAGVRPPGGPVLVTGATGGVGSLAVGLLAKAGYHVAALTGKTDQEALLRGQGAAEVLPRAALEDLSGRPLLHARWAGVVDTVGGPLLAAAVRSTLPGGVIAACGNAASPDLPLTVFPFILRGVSLLGVDATRTLPDERDRLWSMLAGPWKLNLVGLVREVTLDELEPEIERILQGGQVGRVVVRLWETGEEA